MTRKIIYIIIILIIVLVLGWFIFLQPKQSTRPVSDTNVTPSNTNTTSTIGTTKATVMISNSATLGNYLVASNGLTLYVKNGDLGQSSCYGACATNWPPLASSGQLVAGQGVVGQLGTIQRTDGTSQVTYNNQPLYFFVQDRAPGDAKGNGFNGIWSVAKP